MSAKKKTKRWVNLLKVGLDKTLPFILEDLLHERGAHYEKRNPFENFTLVDERLITGQNPSSAKEWVTKIMETCRRND